MLVTNPRRINHEQLRILARNAKGNIDKLYLHWTGCAYGQAFDAYHINIDETAKFTSPAIRLAIARNTPGIATAAPSA